mgnify:CR=1 FL=1
MSLGFYCVSNAQSYILTVPSLRDIWGQPCEWKGAPSPHSTRVIPAESMRNPELVHLLTTERLVLDPKSHALQFREDAAAMAAQYASELGGLYMPPVAVAAPAVVAPTAAEIAAADAAVVAEAEALIAAEEAATKAAEEAAAPAEPAVETPSSSSSSSSKKKR